MPPCRAERRYCPFRPSRLADEERWFEPPRVFVRFFLELALPLHRHQAAPAEPGGDGRRGRGCTSLGFRWCLPCPWRVCVHRGPPGIRRARAPRDRCRSGSRGRGTASARAELLGDLVGEGVLLARRAPPGTTFASASRRRTTRTTRTTTTTTRTTRRGGRDEEDE